MQETDDKPDFTREEFADWATPEQSMTMGALEGFGWKCSHLWERTPGEIIVWCIVRMPESELKAGVFNHCYIEPDGKMHRYQPRRR
jgi:hypothetical protein